MKNEGLTRRGFLSLGAISAAALAGHWACGLRPTQARVRARGQDRDHQLLRHRG